MSKFDLITTRRSFTSSSILVALVWTLWLAPLFWRDLIAADGAPASTTAPWKQGVSTWTGNSYSLPRADPPNSTSQPGLAFDEPPPYTVPVDLDLSTEPVVTTPYDLGQPTTTPANSLTARALGVPELNAPESVSPAKTAEGVPAASADSATQMTPPLLTSPTIGEGLESGVAITEPPLLEETRRWYQYPWRWATVGWKNHAEFGLDGSAGNAETLALQTGAELKRKTDYYTLAVDIDYRFANSRDVTTENNGRYNIDYDRLLNNSPWSMFGKFGLEWDKFKAFDLRLNLNSGVGYHWIRNDRTTFVSRFGAGASRKFGAPIDEWTPEAVFGLDGEQQLNRRNKLKGKVDYFPAWEDFNDYRIVTDLGWEILLDEAENLSLKFGVTDRYDSTPQGAEPNDFYYSALLLVKF